MPVLSKYDFEQYFASNLQYRSDSQWPRETVIIFSAEWDIEHEGFHNKGKEDWQVVKNLPKDETEIAMHAEEFILKHLQEKLYTYHSYKYLNFESREDECKRNLHKLKHASGFLNLKMYASYSPCGNCSKLILDFVNNFSDNIDVHVEIIFDTFYLHYKVENWLGLTELCNQGLTNFNPTIQLKTLSGSNLAGTWTIFLEDMGVKGEITTKKWKKITTKKGRHEREDLDFYILSKLQSELKRSVKVGECFKYFWDFKMHPPCKWSHNCPLKSCVKFFNDCLKQPFDGDCPKKLCADDSPKEPCGDDCQNEPCGEDDDCQNEPCGDDCLKEPCGNACPKKPCNENHEVPYLCLARMTYEQLCALRNSSCK